MVFKELDCCLHFHAGIILSNQENENMDGVLLGLCFLLHIMIPIPGFDFKTFFFFSIGAYFAIEGKNIAEYARRFNYFYIPAAIILLIACTMLQDKYLMGIYIICGVFASFTLCSFLIEKYKIKPIAVLVNSCFFVYAFHPIRIFFWKRQELSAVRYWKDLSSEIRHTFSYPFLIF